MPIQLEDLPLILVSGQARSGTTILTRAIGAHPQVVSNNRENVWLRDLSEFVLQTLSDPTRVRELAVQPEDFLQEFRAAAYRILFPGRLFKEVGEYRALSTFTSLREEMFDALPVFLPNFRLVNIVRNGVDVVASRLKHEHIRHAGNFETHCVAWSHSTDVVSWFRNHRELKDRFFLVRHEQLLDESSCREVFGRIQHRFGLDRSDACQDFVAGNFVSRNKSDESSPQTTAGAVAREQQWKAWSDEQRKTFERVCGSAMSDFGYELPW